MHSYSPFERVFNQRGRRHLSCSLHFLWLAEVWPGERPPEEKTGRDGRELSGEGVTSSGCGEVNLCPGGAGESRRRSGLSTLPSSNGELTRRVSISGRGRASWLLTRPITACRRFFSVLEMPTAVEKSMRVSLRQKSPITASSLRIQSIAAWRREERPASPRVDESHWKRS